MIEYPINTKYPKINPPYPAPILSIIIPDITAVKILGIPGSVIKRENPISSVCNYSLYRF